jgi:hypothetical protein
MNTYGGVDVQLNYCTELLGLFWTLSIVWYIEDKRPQRFGDWICLRLQVDGAGLTVRKR